MRGMMAVLDRLATNLIGYGAILEVLLARADLAPAKLMRELAALAVLGASDHRGHMRAPQSHRKRRDRQRPIPQYQRLLTWPGREVSKAQATLFIAEADGLQIHRYRGVLRIGLLKRFCNHAEARTLALALLDDLFSDQRPYEWRAGLAAGDD